MCFSQKKHLPDEHECFVRPPLLHYLAPDNSKLDHHDVVCILDVLKPSALKNKTMRRRAMCFSKTPLKAIMNSVRSPSSSAPRIYKPLAVAILPASFHHTLCNLRIETVSIQRYVLSHQFSDTHGNDLESSARVLRLALKFRSTDA